MNEGLGSGAPAAVTAHRSSRLKGALAQLTEGGPERQAADAGEIDAVIDYAHGNVILFPAARRALRARARPKAMADGMLLENSLLAALPREERQRLSKHLQAVRLKSADVLHEPEEPLRFVYFPIDSVICLITLVEDRRGLEVGLVGYEGVVGISVVFEASVASVRAQVVAGETALRMDSACLREALRHCPRLRHEFHRYADAKLALARQAAGCNGFHGAEARVARWLLMIGDRLRSREFSLTQEALAGMLGVRRVTVTQAASRLQNRGLIGYARGRIRIVERIGLEAAACRCYRKIADLPSRAPRSSE